MPNYQVTISRTSMRHTRLDEEAVVTVTASSEQEAREAVEHALLEGDIEVLFDFDTVSQEQMEQEVCVPEEIDAIFSTDEPADYTAEQLRGGE